MSKDLSALTNIGKNTASKLKLIGINTKEEFLARDPYEIFEELKIKVDPTLCKCALAGIVGAKKGVAWHKIVKEAEEEYKKRYSKNI